MTKGGVGYWVVVVAYGRLCSTVLCASRAGGFAPPRSRRNWCEGCALAGSLRARSVRSSEARNTGREPGGGAVAMPLDTAEEAARKLESQVRWYQREKLACRVKVYMIIQLVRCALHDAADAVC